MVEYASIPGGGANWYGTPGADTIIMDNLGGFTFDNLIATFGGDDTVTSPPGP